MPLSLDSKVNNHSKIDRRINSKTNDYVAFPKSLNKTFDVVIIDGLYRKECASEVKNLLNFSAKNGAMVILDNSDWFKNTAKFLREDLGLIEIDFHGFGAINAYTWTTSIFLTRNFNFKPLDNIQPHYSLDALHHSND